MSEEEKIETVDINSIPDNPESEEKCTFENISEELLEELLCMGFSRIKALKALHYTKSESLEAALEWIEVHQDDKDINIPICSQNKENKTEEKPRLTKEEAVEKAYELQKKLREERLEKEKKEEIERERNRLKSVKQMQEQQTKLEEEERKRNILFLKKEKLEHAKEREYQRELLKREWEERFGKSYPEKDEAEREKSIKAKSSKDKIIFYCNSLHKTYKGTDKNGLKLCLNTLKAYFKNLHENPTNPKFKSIRKENNAFKTKVAPYNAAVELIKIVGFQEGEETYKIEGCPDGYLLITAIKYIDVILLQL